MRIGRTMPPAAAPLSVRDFLRGLHGVVRNGLAETIAEEFREFHGAKRAFGYSSGKAAFVRILEALHSLKQNRTKVVIPAYTCYSVPAAIRKAGLAVALCDVRPDTLDFDFRELEKSVDEETLCVVSAPLFGIPSDAARAKTIAKACGGYLVEDVSQALGVSPDGRKPGTDGDAAFFSFGRGKNVTCGSGGVAVASTDEIAKRMADRYEATEREPLAGYLKSVLEVALLAIFLRPGLYWVPNGLPFLGLGKTRYPRDFAIRRLTGFKAGVLGDWRRSLEAFGEARSRNGNAIMDRLGLRGRFPMYSGQHPYLRFPLFLKDAEAKRRACSTLSRHGVTPMYPDSLNNLEELREDFAGRRFAGAERVAATLVTLPTHPHLGERDLVAICDAINPYVDRGSDPPVEER